VIGGAVVVTGATVLTGGAGGAVLTGGAGGAALTGGTALTEGALARAAVAALRLLH
jgi:hypothetical protein